MVKLITSIAAQTNPLALNATIEAARAGSAGRGFAVVANEVKELASETAEATTRIGAMIETIQADSARSVEAITAIAELIRSIGAQQTHVASAIEQQESTAQEITTSVSAVAEVARTTTETVAQLQR